MVHRKPSVVDLRTIPSFQSGCRTLDNTNDSASLNHPIRFLMSTLARAHMTEPLRRTLTEEQAAVTRQSFSHGTNSLPSGEFAYGASLSAQQPRYPPVREGMERALTRRKRSPACELFPTIRGCSLPVLVPARRVPDFHGKRRHDSASSGYSSSTQSNILRRNSTADLSPLMLISLCSDLSSASSFCM